MILTAIGLVIVVLGIAYRQHRLVQRVDRLEQRVRDIERHLVL